MDIQQSLDKIRKFYKQKKRLPSYREIARLLNFNSTNAAWRVVKKLIEAGYLDKDSQGKLIPKKLTHELKVLGTVEAGMPTLANQEEMDTVSLDEYLLTNPAKNYMLRVIGRSMIEAGISPNDLVIVKYYQRRNREVILIPANKDYPNIYPKHELRIGGVVVSLIKKYY